MIKLAHTIDSNGFMLEPVIVASDTENTSEVIVTRCPDGFYKPRWNGTEWVDALADQQKLDNVKSIQIAQIRAGLNATLTGGFTSKTTGHKYVTTTNGQTNMECDLKRFDLDTTLTSVQFFTMDSDWLAHTHQQLISAFLDGGKWKDAQFSHNTDLKNQVNAILLANYATVQDAINAVKAITWSEATY